MDNVRSDTLVFFGATGDLAYKKIFSSLQAMIKRGDLNVPVIGVAKAGWNLEQFHARIKDAVEKHGGVDPAAFRKLISLARYVDGDYKDPATFQKLRAELKDAQHPAHYLAIPPSLFAKMPWSVQVLIATDFVTQRIWTCFSDWPKSGRSPTYLTSCSPTDNISTVSATLIPKNSASQFATQ